MTTGTLYCAVCQVELMTADADDAVMTDAGPVHRECFEGPVTPVDTTAQEYLDADDEARELLAATSDVDLGEEEVAREEHNDVPLPPDGPDSFYEDAAGGRWAVDHKLRYELGGDDEGRQRERYEKMMGEFPVPPPHVGHNSNTARTPATAPSRFPCCWQRLGRL